MAGPKDNRQDVPSSLAAQIELKGIRAEVTVIAAKLAAHIQEELDAGRVVSKESLRELLQAINPAAVETGQEQPRKRPAGPSATDTLLDHVVSFNQDRDAVETSYMAKHLVQCTLPHSDPGDVPVWTRTNGRLTLAVRPYVDLKTHKPLYPYGSIPRLLLFWIVTEAKQKKSRHIRLGNSLDAFMREIGLNPRTGGGKRGDAARLHSQMERLFRATVTFENRQSSGVSYVDMQVGPKAQLWWDTSRSHQDNLWDSWVELGEDFYAAVTESAVPMDTRALRALKRSPLALDLYAWLTYTTFVANRSREPRVVPWEGLHGQMGAEYAELRQFRDKALKAITKIKTVYPELQVDSSIQALTIKPGKTAIPSSKVRISTQVLR